MTEPFPSRFPTKNFCLRRSVCFKGVGLNTPHLAGTKRPHLQLAWPVCKASGSCPRTHLAPSHWPLTTKWQLRRETRERENKWKLKKKKVHKETREGRRVCWRCDTGSGMLSRSKCGNPMGRGSVLICHLLYYLYSSVCRMMVVFKWHNADTDLSREKRHSRI